MKIDGITDAAVVGVEDGEWGQKVVAYIVNSECRIRNSELRMQLKGKLTAFKNPKEYIQVPSIPRNELGKIDYEKLSKHQS